MKNAIILHGTDANHEHNWFPWLKKELEANGYQVWVPDLPGADKPNIDSYNQFLSKNCPFDLDKDTTLIGHSSGAVAILGWLQSLPTDTKVGKCYLVGAFTDDLGWDELKNLFDPPLDFGKIRDKSEKLIFIHSDDDPFCPLKNAQNLSEELDGKMHLVKGQKHFSISTNGPEYSKFPFLLELILKE